MFESFFVILIIGIVSAAFLRKNKERRNLFYISVGVAAFGLLGAAASVYDEEDGKPDEEVQDPADNVEENEVNDGDKPNNENNIDNENEGEDIVNNEDNAEEGTDTEDEQELTLKVSLEEFRDNFDNAADEFDLPFRINRVAEVEEGAVNNSVKLITASEYVNSFAALSRDNEILSITLIGSGDGSDDSGFEILAAIGATIAATQPELSPDERGEILRDLGIISDGELPEEMTSAVSGEYIYSFEYNDLAGVMFFVEPKEE